MSDILTIDGYPIRSSARVFHDVDGNPCTLAQLIEREPAWAKNRILDLEVQLTEAKAKYEELILAVGYKYPDETRHQTALRYIRRCEEPENQTACADKTTHPNKPEGEKC